MSDRWEYPVGMASTLHQCQQSARHFMPRAGQNRPRSAGCLRPGGGGEGLVWSCGLRLPSWNCFLRNGKHSLCLCSSVMERSPKVIGSEILSIWYLI